MALITSDCGTARSLSIKWPVSPRVVRPSAPAAAPKFVYLLGADDFSSDIPDGAFVVYQVPPTPLPPTPLPPAPPHHPPLHHQSTPVAVLSFAVIHASAGRGREQIRCHSPPLSRFPQHRLAFWRQFKTCSYHHCTSNMPPTHWLRGRMDHSHTCGVLQRHRTIHKHGSRRTSGFDSPHRASSLAKTVSSVAVRPRWPPTGRTT